tara:strand:- start:371 stop:1060 length:690 start_codon:yes stop_codon:yes gene_type:complete
MGDHDTQAFGTLNVGTSLGDFKSSIKGLAMSVEGDVEIAGDPNGDNFPNAVIIQGDLVVNGKIDGGNKGRLAARFSDADDRPKPFDIKHPSKEGHRLRYACIEGPEVAVYYRGRLRGNNIIELPYYWRDLVHEDSITVELQPIGKKQYLIIESFNNREIVIKDYNADMGGQIDCFFHVYGERKDINPLITEYEGEKCTDYPDPNHHSIPDEERNYNDPNYRGDRNTITM